MGDRKNATIAVNSATTGTSLASQRISGIVAGAVSVAITAIAAGVTPEDFGYLSREILTGFPELRYNIRKGWKEHRGLWATIGKHEHL
jgi:hypothetical protein